MTKVLGNGTKDASNTKMAENQISDAGIQVAMLLALQSPEWQKLKNESGVVFKTINFQEPVSNRKVLLIAIGTQEDDITAIDETLDVFINGVSIDAIVEGVAENKKGSEKRK